MGRALRNTFRVFFIFTISTVLMVACGDGDRAKNRRDLKKGGEKTTPHEGDPRAQKPGDGGSTGNGSGNAGASGNSGASGANSGGTTPAGSKVASTTRDAAGSNATQAKSTETIVKKSDIAVDMRRKAFERININLVKKSEASKSLLNQIQAVQLIRKQNGSDFLYTAKMVVKADSKVLRIALQMEKEANLDQLKEAKEMKVDTRGVDNVLTAEIEKAIGKVTITFISEQNELLLTINKDEKEGLGLVFTEEVNPELVQVLGHESDKSVVGRLSLLVSKNQSMEVLLEQKRDIERAVVKLTELTKEDAKAAIRVDKYINDVKDLLVHLEAAITESNVIANSQLGKEGQLLMKERVEMTNTANRAAKKMEEIKLLTAKTAQEIKTAEQTPKSAEVVAILESIKIDDKEVLQQIQNLKQ